MLTTIFSSMIGMALKYGISGVAALYAFLAHRKAKEIHAAIIKAAK